MKKFSLLLITTSLLLSACSSNQEKLENEIPLDSTQKISQDTATNSDGSTNSPKPNSEVECAPHSHINGNGTLKSVDGLTLEILSSKMMANREESLRFKIINSDGKPLSDFAITHTKPMHVILVKKNLDGYLHIHPTVDAEGIWSSSVVIPSGGTWQVIADIQTLEGLGYNLGTFIEVKGSNKSFTLPDPVEDLEVDGVSINISGMVSPEEHGMLLITATKSGTPLILDQYLGANAHLVAIKEDGSYAHMHPHSMKSMDACSEGEMPVTDPFALEDAQKGMMHFMTEVPGEGRYRFFLQFMSSGKLYTVPFTLDVN